MQNINDKIRGLIRNQPWWQGRPWWRWWKWDWDLRITTEEAIRAKH
jgi:hypothetical protein